MYIYIARQYIFYIYTYYYKCKYKVYILRVYLFNII